MRRVRKEEVQFDTWVKPDPLEICLDCWRSWMGRDDKDTGIKSQRLLNGDGDGYGDDDTPAQRRDNEIALATDAMIGGLIQYERWAIHRRCGICTQWRFNEINFADALASAEKNLTEKLKNNIATRTLF